ncbi:hypothetical protein A9996_08995 [Gelidibacter algens]|nr:hypothetical protein A9996_08995 [Gelidibacter algens]
MERVSEGKVNLYQDFVSSTMYVPNMAAGGGYGFAGSSSTLYYISRGGSDTVINLRACNTYSNRFKKMANDYFKDCNDLIDKINSKYFDRYGIQSVVNYYNEDCN